MPSPSTPFIPLPPPGHGAGSARLLGVARSPLGGLLLIAVCLVAYLPGFFSIPAVDRDESRFAQASRQMMAAESVRGWVVPMVQDRPRLNKPPAIYWAQATSAALFTGRWTGASPAETIARDAIWMYRIPSLLAAIAAVLCTWRLGLRFIDPRAALLAGAALAVSPVIWWEARQARADMLLVAVTTASLLPLSTLLLRPAAATIRTVLAFWSLLALGVLVKGPVTPMVTLGGALLFALLSRKSANASTPGVLSTLAPLRPVLGLLIAAAIVAPWVVLTARAVGFSEYFRIVYAETIGRSTEPAEGHAGFPGIHTLLLAVLMAPAALALGPAAVHAFRRGFSRGLPQGRTGSLALVAALRARPRVEAFLVCCILPSWLVFEAVSTRLPHYTMPLLPLVALLLARGMLSRAAWATLPRWLSRLGLAIYRLALPAFFLLCAGAFTWLLRRAHGPDAPPYGWVGVGLILGAVAVWLALLIGREFRRGRAVGAFVHGAGAVVLGGALLTGCLRLLPEAATSRRAALAIHALDPHASRPLACLRSGPGFTGYDEDSLIFETRGRILRISHTDLPAWLAQNPSAIIVLPCDAVAAGPGLRTVQTLEGFNYSKGKRISLAIAEAAP